MSLKEFEISDVTIAIFVAINFISFSNLYYKEIRDNFRRNIENFLPKNGKNGLTIGTFENITCDDKKYLHYCKLAKIYKNIFIALNILGVLTVMAQNTIKIIHWDLSSVLFIEIILGMFCFGLQREQLCNIKDYYLSILKKEMHKPKS